VDATPLHQNSGGQTAAINTTPIVVALAGADTTAAGSTLLVCFFGASVMQVTSAPSGWVKFGPASATNIKPTWFRRGPTEGLAAGESSWSFTPGSGVLNPLGWVVLEYPNLDPDAPLDVLPISLTSTSSGTTSVNTTTTISSTYDGLALSFHGSYMSTGGVSDSWGSHTGGFVEIAEQAINDGTKSVDLSVSGLPVEALGTFGATATVSRTLDGTNPGFSLTFVLTSATARKAADLIMLDGAEQGTVAGITVGGTTTTPVVGSLNGAVTCDAAAARSGNFGWRLVGTASAANFGWSSTTGLPNGTQQLNTRPVFVRHFRLLTLPAADTVLWTTTDVGTVALVLRFIAATGKLGLKLGSGTEQVSDAAVTANQWFRVDLRADRRTTTHTADWQVTYNAELTGSTAPVAQTQASGTGSANSLLQTYTVGPTATGTFEIHTDDGAGSGNPGHYPLGDIRVLPLTVDPAGTVTVSGSTANFGVMTANGTIGAWNAANALAAVDDVPPTIGASADGVVAVTASATDYVEFPMQTYNAAANGAAIRGVRAIAALWAASTTAATIRLLASDGTTTYTLFSEADPNADNSTTAPVWVAAIVRTSATVRPVWTQAKLDALALRMGSNDATPDIGIHSIMAEVAVRADPQTVRVAEVTGLEGVTSTAFVDARLDADSGAPIAYDATPAPDFDAAVTYTERGADTNTPLPAGAAVASEIVGADTVDDVTNLSIGPA
jgi:hypothetical protein